MAGIRLNTLPCPPHDMTKLLVPSAAEGTRNYTCKDGKVDKPWALVRLLLCCLLLGRVGVAGGAAQQRMLPLGIRCHPFYCSGGGVTGCVQAAPSGPRQA